MVDGTRGPPATQLFHTARLPACCSPSPHQPSCAASAPSLEQANRLASIKQEDEKLQRWEIRGMRGGGGGNLGIDLPASSLPWLSGLSPAWDVSPALGALLLPGPRAFFALELWARTGKLRLFPMADK